MTDGGKQGDGGASNGIPPEGDGEAGPELPNPFAAEPAATESVGSTVEADLFTELDEASFEEADGAAQPQGAAFQLGEPATGDMSPSYQDQISTAGHELHKLQDDVLTAAHDQVDPPPGLDDPPTDPNANGDGPPAWSDVGLDDPPTSPSHIASGPPEELPDGFEDLGSGAITSAPPSQFEMTDDSDDVHEIGDSIEVLDETSIESDDVLDVDDADVMSDDADDADDDEADTVGPAPSYMPPPPTGVDSPRKLTRGPTRPLVPRPPAGKTGTTRAPTVATAPPVPTPTPTPAPTTAEVGPAASPAPTTAEVSPAASPAPSPPPTTAELQSSGDDTLPAADEVESVDLLDDETIAMAGSPAAMMAAMGHAAEEDGLEAPETVASVSSDDDEYASITDDQIDSFDATLTSPPDEETGPTTAPMQIGDEKPRFIESSTKEVPVLGESDFRAAMEPGPKSTKEIPVASATDEQSLQVDSPSGPDSTQKTEAVPDDYEPAANAPEPGPDSTQEIAAATSPFDLSPVSSDELIPVAAPSFDEFVEIIDDDAPLADDSFAFQVSDRLRTQVTSVTALKDIAPPDEPVAEHADVDPRPFIESLRRNPNDRAALSALKRIYAAGDRWEELIEVLLEQTEHVATPEERTPFLREVAAIFDENLGAPDKAQVALLSAFLLDPLDNDVAQQLGDVTGRAGLWAVMFSELGQAVAQEPQAIRRAALCGRLGDWYVQAGHLDYALPCYQQSLTADPRELRAMSGIALLFEHGSEFEQLDQALAHIPPALPPSTPVDLYLRVSGLFERRGNDQAAGVTLEQALSDHADNEEIIEALERTLGRQQRWGELADRLSRRAEGLKADDPDAAVELWRRSANLLADEAGDHAGAERAARDVLDIQSSDKETLALLDRLYSTDERWSELAWVLEQQLEHATSSKDRVSLLLRLGRLDTSEFVRLDEAIGRYRQVIDIEPRNAEAHESLTSLLRRQQQWVELADALEQQARADRDETARAPRLVEAAQVRAGELAQVTEAVALLRSALKLTPRDTATLRLLADTLVQANELAAAFDTYKEEADAAQEPTARAAALVRAADIAREKLFRKPEALELLEEALSLDPSLQDAAASLRQERLADGDWEGAARALEGEVAQASGPNQRGKLLLELGELLRDRLHREGDAVTAYEQALEALGEVREVAEPLFELYLSQERPNEAAGLTQALARTANKSDFRAYAQELVRYAQISLGIGDKAEAQGHLKAAVGADPSNAEALPLLADLYEEQEHWDDARQVLVSLVGVERTVGTASPDLMARLGRVSRLAGRNEDARRWFEQVLDVQPNHNEALRQLTAIAEAANDFPRALDLLSRVQVDDDDVRYGHSNRLVELAQKAKDDFRYEQALLAVLEVRPDDHKALTRLLEVNSKKGDWAKATEIIETLAETVKDNAKARAKYFSAAAKIYRDKVGNLEAAAKMYEQLLDVDWENNLAEFASLDKMLTGARMYQQQERAYRHMIARVTGKDRPDLEAQLWHALGEIYRSRLNELDKAAEAFTVAAGKDPDNIERQLILAELYQALNKPDEAIARHMELLRLQPGRLESLKIIREISSATGLYERAFCVVSALSALGQATQPEQEFFEQWLPQPIINATGPLNEEDWLRHLRHPDEDPFISGIFETILSLVLANRARPPKEFGLSSATAVDFNQQGASVLAKQFMALVRVSGLRMPPQLHIVREQPTLMAYAVTNPVSSIVGGAIAQVSEAQRIFIMARHLAFYQGGRYLAILCPSRAELGAVLVTAVALITGQDQNVPDRKFLAYLRGELQKAPPLLERLNQVVQRFVARGGKADFDAWLRGVEMTACRAGVLMVSDPRVAAAALERDMGSPASVTTRDRVQDLLNFVVSEDYLVLRKNLGVQVG